MPINTTEIFPRTPKISSGKLLTANIASDGTGSVVTVFTAGESGAKIDQIKIRSLGSNVSTVVRFFINNGSTNEDEENNILVHETRVDRTTVSEIESLPDYDVVIRKGGVAFSPIPFLPAGYKINVTTGKTLSSGLQVTVHGYEYDEVTPELLNGLSFADDDTNSDSTIITLGAPSVPGNTFRYFVSINANPVGIPDTGYDLSAWTAVADGDSIVAPHGQHIGVAEVDGSNLCVQFSDALTVTETIAMVSVGTPTGDAIVGEELTAGTLSPLGADVTYQWYSCAIVDGTYAEIAGATASTYTLVIGDVGNFIKVYATGTGDYTGTVESTATAVVRQVCPSLSNGLSFADDDANDTDTVITLGAPSTPGNTFVYKISVDSNAVPAPLVGDDLSLWTAVINSASITATNGKHIGVAEIDGSSLAVQFSDATAVTLPEIPALVNGLSFADDDLNDTDTVITLGAPSIPGNTFVYKISVDSNAVPAPEIGDNLSTWTAVINSASITATNGKHIGVAEIDGSSLAVQFSDATAVTLPE